MEKQQGNGLIYGLNDKPPFKEAFFAALQHLLAIFVAIITPPLIIAGALKLDAETTGYLVSMALFAFVVAAAKGGLSAGPVLWQFPLFHVLAGGALLGAIFMATDYSTSPMTVRGGVIFGVGIGAITMCIQIGRAHV